MDRDFSEKSKIVDFASYRKKREDAISLNSWVSSFRDDEEMREIFLNMDRAMKYLHERGYCVRTFDPNHINILNNSVNQIKLETLKMPLDQGEQRKIIKEDIYNSSFIQIGLYSNCLSYLNKDFLKSNFDEFSRFVPEGDIPYYRGVIDRGASVYFSEYAMEKVNRDIAAMEESVNGSAGVQKSITPQKRKYDDTGINDRINDSIYGDISKGRREAAFVSFMLFPTAILVLGMIFTVIAWVISMM